MGLRVYAWCLVSVIWDPVERVTEGVVWTQIKVGGLSTVSLLTFSCCAAFPRGKISSW